MSQPPPLSISCTIRLPLAAGVDVFTFVGTSALAMPFMFTLKGTGVCSSATCRRGRAGRGVNGVTLGPACVSRAHLLGVIVVPLAVAHLEVPRRCSGDYFTGRAASTGAVIREHLLYQFTVDPCRVDAAGAARGGSCPVHPPYPKQVWSAPALQVVNGFRRLPLRLGAAWHGAVLLLRHLHGERAQPWVRRSASAIVAGVALVAPHRPPHDLGIKPDVLDRLLVHVPARAAGDRRASRQHRRDRRLPRGKASHALFLAHARRGGG